MARGTRPSATDPAHADNWDGGYYELAIKLGPADDTRLDSALKAMWQSARLGAPLRRVDGQDSAVTFAGLLDGRLDAVAVIPGLGSTLASVIVVREGIDEAGRTLVGDDWLDLCLPLGALGSLDGRVGAYPFDDASDSRTWREPIEQWFESVASAVFEAVSFVHTITGHEVSGLEPNEETSGGVRVFRPGSEGRLQAVPVSVWS